MMDPDSQEQYRFGVLTVVGTPNVGKSTLVNHLTGSKVSIVSHRPQTTRHRIMGIRSLPDAQLVFVDTPGLHFDQRKWLNRLINRVARSSVEDVDLIIFMIDHRGWIPEARKALSLLVDTKIPVILIINKCDLMQDKTQLLPLIDESRQFHEFQEIVPVSALKDDLDSILIPTLVTHVPEGPAGFPADQVSDRGPGFQATELLREQLYAQLGDELPYESAVELSSFDRSDPDFWKIEMTIWVERPGQKGIVIGKNGQGLKRIGERARKAIEKQFGVRVRLDCWVKQRQGWRDNLTTLNSLGYNEE